MKYQIDQSGKIERTDKNTILCISNDQWFAVIIKAKTKRQIQEIFRRNGQNKNFVLFTFSAGIALLLERNLAIKEVMIDKEYCGKDALIKKIVLEMLKEKGNCPEIYFDFIGKKAGAHHKAYAVAIGKLPASYEVSLKDILAKTKKTEVGKRLKSA